MYVTIYRSLKGHDRIYTIGVCHHLQKPPRSRSYTGSNSQKRTLKESYCSEKKSFDRLNRKYKRKYLIEKQNSFEEKLMASNQKDFWKSIGKLGISSERNQRIPWSVIDNEGAVPTDKNVVLGKWKSDFEQLFSIDQITRPPVNDNDTFGNQPDVTELNEPISREEIIVAVERIKLRKAAGFDEIPTEVLKNQTAINLLFIICNRCFELGRVPDQWTKGIINPIY